MIDSLFFQAGNVNLAFRRVYEAICATVHFLASNLERALARIRCTEDWVTAVANAENELAIMAANRRLINECSKRRNEIRSSRKQPEELCS
jgi:hypothetical protein